VSAMRTAVAHHVEKKTDLDHATALIVADEALHWFDAKLVALRKVLELHKAILVSTEIDGHPCLVKVCAECKKKFPCKSATALKGAKL